MDDFDDLEFENQDETDDEILDEEDFDGVGLGFRSLPVGDSYLFIHDLPACLKGEEFDCYFCEFFSPENCKLRNDPSLMAELNSLFDLYRLEQANIIEGQAERQEAFISAVQTELKSHGRLLHYTVLAKIVADRHPELDISEKSVLVSMSWHSDIFEKVDKGVYQLK